MEITISSPMTTAIPSAPAIAPIVNGMKIVGLLSEPGCIVVVGLGLLIMILLDLELLNAVLLGCTVEGSGPPE